MAIRSGIPLKIAAKVDKADQEYWDETIEPMIDRRHPPALLPGAPQRGGAGAAQRVVGLRTHRRDARQLPRISAEPRGEPPQRGGHRADAHRRRPRHPRRSIRAAKGWVASITAAMPFSASHRASPPAPPNPPMRVATGSGRGAVVRPASDKVAAIDPTSPEFRFCGARAITGLPYCTQHAQVAYQPAAERKRDRRVAGFR